ncbi:MAG: molybdopterin molybdotransferase MoeA [Planctomycetaceae bacterium]|nr:molybdopterin molybdotransferase MoeA [Planctomycetaceae bacterium]
MLTVPEAQQLVLAESAPLPSVACELHQAAGLILSESVRSGVDSPPFDKSMMDGYALRAADVHRSGVSLEVIGELTAGGEFQGEVAHGTAVRIMTGAPLPVGADAVVRFEDARLDQGQVHVDLSAVAPGANVIGRGRMFQTGEVLLDAGRLLRAQELALLAEVGRASVRVHPSPCAAILATGDELVPPGTPLGPGQICNSNETLLLAQLRTWGCRVQGLGIARDREDELRERIQTGLEQDVLLLTGGVSMGTLDLVPKVLAELGVRQVFHKVRMKPGKPVWFGVRDPVGRQSHRTLIFALPGNPVSSMVCSELFVRAAVAGLAGNPAPIPQSIPARLTRDHPQSEDRPTWFPAWLEFGPEGPLVTPTSWKGSADIRSTVNANSLISFPQGERTYPLGHEVHVLPFDDQIGRIWSGRRSGRVSP